MKKELLSNTMLVYNNSLLTLLLIPLLKIVLCRVIQCYIVFENYNTMYTMVRFEKKKRISKY